MRYPICILWILILGKHFAFATEEYKDNDLYNDSESDVEEFRVESPKQLNDLALQEFIQARKNDPDNNANMSQSIEQGIVYQAQQFGVNRYDMIDTERLKVKTNVHDPDVNLGLPSPERIDDLPGDVSLRSAINSNTNNRNSNENSKNDDAASTAVMSLEQRQALSIEINENIGLGAIAKAGAITLGMHGILFCVIL
jgi:hypothetical protein